MKVSLESLRKRYNNKCFYCGIDLTDLQATRDHYKPKSRGGSDSINNLVLCCRVCNVTKSDLDPYQFIQNNGIKISAPKRLKITKILKIQSFRQSCTCLKLPHHPYCLLVFH